MNNLRTIQSVLKDNTIDLTGFSGNPKDWLCKQPDMGAVAWLLAYADDGLIWGKIEGGKLLLAHEVFKNSSPELQVETLQHLYLFSEKAEIHVWKDAGSLKVCRLKDGPDVVEESITRDLILWGTKVFEGPDDRGFTWMEDGGQGLRHAVPLKVDTSKLDEDKLLRPLRLSVRQYLDYDADGQVFVTAVRLVKLYEE